VSNATTRRPAKPAAPKATPAPAPAPAAPAPCGCGCGAPTHRAEARYLSGHDARHAGQVGRALVAGGDPEALLATLPTDALRAKATGMVEAHAAREAKKAARKAATEAARAAAKAAYAAALAG
jgi:hypothetical protein